MEKKTEKKTLQHSQEDNLQVSEPLDVAQKWGLLAANATGTEEDLPMHFRMT